MSLSSLIVQREIATIREVEEALARQVLYGGDFVTNLLEVCRVDEAALVAVVAESFGMAPAPPGELPIPDTDTKRVVAPEVAGERNIFPIAMDRYGLTLAVATPLTKEAEQELTFALALPIEQKLAPLVRIRQALARDFGLPLDRRQQRLLSRILGDSRGSSYPPPRAAPEFKAPPRPPSIAPPEMRQASITPRVMPKVDGTFVRDTDIPPGPKAKRRRGPLMVEVAKAELEEAAERDTIFDLVFEFSRQFFDYTALFVVHGDVAEGRDAFGDGASREKIARVGAPLELGGILGKARKEKTMVREIPENAGIDAILMNDLGRTQRTECLVFPIVVRTRTVALVLCDTGESGIDKDALDDVQKVVAAGVGAFERLIVRRKLLGTNPPPSSAAKSIPPPPTMVSEQELEPPPPLRDLVVEPMTTRDVPARMMTIPPATTMSAQAASAPLSSPPSSPPANLLVRRPSGPPIPREEPTIEDFGKISIPYPVSSGAVPPPASPSSPPSKKVTSRRPDAPPLEFGATPASSSPQSEPPPSPPAAARTTDVSPGALPMLPVVPEIDESETPIAPPIFEQAPPPSSGRIPVLSSELRWEAPDTKRVPMPASEQSVSVALHRPPSSRRDSSVLPSVIVDVSSEYVQLVDRVLKGGDEEAESALIRAGGYAMSAIMAKFPGPVTRESPRASECGPVLKLVASQRRTALPSVLALVDDADEERRFWATSLLAELVYPDAIGKIVERTFDRSARVRKAALAAARAMAESHPGAMVDRYAEFATDLSVEQARRIEATIAIGAIRDAAGVPVLIQLLQGDTKAAAKASLVLVTRQDFADDAARWNKWWSEHQKAHRVEWLIDSLMHEDQAIRKAAGEELSGLTKEYFGYYDDLAKRERERAQSRYREWWANVGRFRFIRST